ncbi:hypothetical protein C1645_811353, partial [Glomus cerebriforme]
DLVYADDIEKCKVVKKRRGRSSSEVSNYSGEYPFFIDEKSSIITIENSNKIDERTNEYYSLKILDYIQPKFSPNFSSISSIDYNENFNFDYYYNFNHKEFDVFSSKPKNGNQDSFNDQLDWYFGEFSH